MAIHGEFYRCYAHVYMCSICRHAVIADMQMDIRLPIIIVMHFTLGIASLAPASASVGLLSCQSSLTAAAYAYAETFLTRSASMCQIALHQSWVGAHIPA